MAQKKTNEELTEYAPEVETTEETAPKETKAPVKFTVDDLIGSKDFAHYQQDYMRVLLPGLYAKEEALHILREYFKEV